MARLRPRPSRRRPSPCSSSQGAPVAIGERGRRIQSTGCGDDQAAPPERPLDDAVPSPEPRDARSLPDFSATRAAAAGTARSAASARGQEAEAPDFKKQMRDLGDAVPTPEAREAAIPDFRPPAPVPPKPGNAARAAQADSAATATATESRNLGAGTEAAGPAPAPAPDLRHPGTPRRRRRPTAVLPARRHLASTPPGGARLSHLVGMPCSPPGSPPIGAIPRRRWRSVRARSRCASVAGGWSGHRCRDHGRKRIERADGARRSPCCVALRVPPPGTDVTRTVRSVTALSD